MILIADVPVAAVPVAEIPVAWLAAVAYSIFLERPVTAP